MNGYYIGSLSNKNRSFIFLDLSINNLNILLDTELTEIFVTFNTSQATFASSSKCMINYE